MATTEYYYLNPHAPEFYPIFHTYFTNNFTLNLYNLNYYHHNNFPYSSPPPPPTPPPPPPPPQLPHHVNYQNYPYNCFLPNIDHHHHHHHVNLMQPQSQLGPPGPAHFSPNPSPVWPKNQPFVGPTRRWSDCGGGSSSNCGRKQGFRCNFSDNYGLGRGKSIGNSWRERKNKEKQMILSVKPNGSETTAMIRNIPNQYTREMLIKFLDEFCRIENQRLEPNDDHQPFAFDFLYLPMDFKKDANKGYAFVNFTHPNAVWKLHLACSNRRWEHCKSPKICNINYATIQGYENLVEHFGSSRFVCDHEDYLPVCFNPPRDGSGGAVTETTIGKRFSSSSKLETDHSMN